MIIKLQSPFWNWVVTSKLSEVSAARGGLYLTMSELEKRGGAEVAPVEEEKKRLLSEEVTVLDFDMLCLTVAMQVEKGNGGNLNITHPEHKFMCFFILIWILHNHKLSGSISPDIGKLESLQILALHGNNLYGEIPPELGNCTQLQSLHIQLKEEASELKGNDCYLLMYLDFH